MILALAGLAPLSAQVQVGYWDLNGTLARSAGSSGSLSAELLNLGIGTIGFGTGSTVNLQPGFTAGSSLGFFDLVSLAESGRVTISNLDFSGLSSPTVSLAVRSNPGFTLSDEFRIEYRIGAGLWTTAAVLPNPTTSFELVTHTFAPNLLDNVPNAAIRLSFSSVATVVNIVEIDNLRVTAVPEPGTIGLLAVTAIGLTFLRRRAKTPSGA